MKRCKQLFRRRSSRINRKKTDSEGFKICEPMPVKDNCLFGFCESLSDLSEGRSLILSIASGALNLGSAGTFGFLGDIERLASFKGLSEYGQAFPSFNISKSFQCSETQNNNS